ncbi:MAG TPA: carbon-nitrogen hydrolase family protein, partial [Tissierellia bacterium]|nr:carbon-nitrogen hydrolase family protein [Tissierellia bacterium]
AWGLARGTSTDVFDTPFGKLGIIVGTDAWYPETGRILALSGAGLICHPGALPEPKHTWLQFAGMWSQVQQNQFFCVESQLCTEIAGWRAGGETLIHAPCEMTAAGSGILARGGEDGRPVTAELDDNRRREVISRYPLLKLLQPEAYSPIYPEKGGRP